MAEILCRCCLADKAPCKMLSVEYSWMGEREVYVEMLLESFNIMIEEPQVGAGICEACVARLRDATSFKRQVVHAQRLYRQLDLAEGKSELIVEPKEEIATSGDDEACGGLLNSDEDDKDMMPLSTFASKQKKKAKKKNISALTGRSRAKGLVKLEEASQTYAKRSLDVMKKGSKIVIGATTIKPLTNKSAKEEGNTAENLVKDESAKNSFIQIVDCMPHVIKPSFDAMKAMPDRVKYNVNMSAMVKFSNVTPFKDKIHDGYICFYCVRVFSDPDLLREHTASEHTKDKLSFFDRLKTHKEDVKVDITALRCAVCSEEMADLNALKQHLVLAHEKNIFQHLRDRMLPFKLTKDAPLYCTICSQAFETFRMLHVHMNSHYRNFICGQCSAGFVTIKRLKYHEARHRVGDYRCEPCNKTFQSRVKLNCHRKGVHQGMWQRNKCPHCPEKFTNYYKKQKHLVEAHNEAKIEYRCNACDKEFANKSRLTNHTKQYHLQELNFECDMCGQRFFARRELSRHVERHSRRRVECGLCQKTFASETTLKVHRLKHAEHQPYGCEKCGKTFKNKISFENHENTHTAGEIIPDSILNVKT